MTTLIRRAGMLDVVERRLRPLDVADFGIRAAAGSAEPQFFGHCAVYDSRTSIGNPMSWGWYEEMATGMADKTLAEFDQRMLVDHDTSKVVARRSAGDLRMWSDSVGVATEADLDVEVSYIADFARNLDRKRITGMSIGFRVVRDDWQTEQIEATDPKGRQVSIDVDVRRILEIQLLEASGVTFPAYEDTDAGLRSMALEVRAARGLPKTRGDADAADPAPPAEGTRGDDAAPPAKGTRCSVQLLTFDVDALAARYGLGR